MFFTETEFIKHKMEKNWNQAGTTRSNGTRTSSLCVLEATGLGTDGFCLGFTFFVRETT